MAKIFAIYGSSGAYKTTTALALANHISKTQPKANIIVVGTDVTKPIIPIVAPNNKEFTGSLGRCLSDVSFEETDLRRNLLPMVITIPHDFAWGSTAPMRFTLHVKSKWVAKF